MVESQERQESDLKRLEKNLDKAQTEATRQLRELSRQSFACIADALKAANKLSIAVLGYVRYIFKAGKLDNTESLRTSLV